MQATAARLWRMESVAAAMLPVHTEGLQEAGSGLARRTDCCSGTGSNVSRKAGAIQFRDTEWKGNINMKTSALLAFFAYLAIGVSFGSPAAPLEKPPQTYCSLKTLDGSYLYLTHGYLEGAPYVSSGIMSFDGTGKVAVIYTRSVERAQLSTTGTYTVAGNCSGSMKLATGTVNDFYLSPSGDSFNWVRSTGAVGGEAKRVARELVVR